MSRDLIVNWLSYCFDRVALPAELSSVNQRELLLISADSSIPLQALISSFARRLSRVGPLRLKSDKSVLVPTKGEVLIWAPLSDCAELSEYLKIYPNTASYTLSVFFRYGPIRGSSNYELSFLDSLLLIIQRRNSLIIAERIEPIPTQVISSGRTLSRRLKVEFYRHIKRVRGTPFQSISTQRDVVLAGTEFEQEIQTVARSLGISVAQAKKRASKEFFSIAANPVRWVYMLMAFFARIILKSVFSSLKVDGLERFSGLPQGSSEHPIVLIPTHRSHFDYIIVGSILYQARLNTPLVAAGINLSFWPIGFFIRSVGAYFVKRDAKRDIIHGLVLKRYVTYLVKRGHLQEFFIEGGRSRSGRMRPPKLGLLRVIIEAYLKNLRKDVLFVPVSISYERVVEDNVFGFENTGKAKIKENLFTLLKAASIFKNSYGDVDIRFGAPLALSSFIPKRLVGTAQARNLSTEFADHLVQRIQAQSSITLTSLALTALLVSARYGLEKDSLVRAIKELYRLHLVCSGSAEGRATSSLENFLAGRDELLEQLPRTGIVEVRKLFGRDLYYVPGRKRFTADFYKNSALHLFFIPALLSLLELLELELSLENALKFHELFRTDFVLPETQIFSDTFRSNIKSMRESELLVETYTKLRFTNRNPGIFNPALLLSTFESHLWVYQQLLTFKPSGSGGSIVVPYQEFVERAQNEFTVATKLGLFERIEASSKANLTSSLESLASRKIIQISTNNQVKSIKVLSIPRDEMVLISRAISVIRTFLEENLTRSAQVPMLTSD